jgi:hypothetical protein
VGWHVDYRGTDPKDGNNERTKRLARLEEEMEADAPKMFAAAETLAEARDKLGSGFADWFRAKPCSHTPKLRALVGINALGLDSIWSVFMTFPDAFTSCDAEAARRREMLVARGVDVQAREQLIDEWIAGAA